MVLALSGFLRKIAGKGRKSKKENKKKNRILVLVDWPNFLRNIPIGTSPSPGFSITGGFERMIVWLQQFGEIEDVFLFFSSRQSIEIYGLKLRRQGFNLVYSPRIPEKEKKETEDRDNTDVVDNALIEFARKIIQRNPLTITHLCLASGDQDYILVLKEAVKKGLEIIIVAPDKDFLSQKDPFSKKLRSYASKDFKSGKQMIYIFSPVPD